MPQTRAANMRPRARTASETAETGRPSSAQFATRANFALSFSAKAQNVPNRPLMMSTPDCSGGQPKNARNHEFEARPPPLPLSAAGQRPRASRTCPACTCQLRNHFAASCAELCNKAVKPIAKIDRGPATLWKEPKLYEHYTSPLFRKKSLKPK